MYWIIRDDYPAFRRLFPNNPEFPASYNSWEQFARQQITETEVIGDSVRTAIIHPEDYTGWCNAAGLNYNSASLGAFAVVTDRQEQQRRT